MIVAPVPAAAPSTHDTNLRPASPRQARGLRARECRRAPQARRGGAHHSFRDHPIAPYALPAERAVEARMCLARVTLQPARNSV